ncbi:uncharacterized protein LOC113236111 [Hyposmocoma kahamanoa]|uniref:uncharacterized protein LOC113236111 n=1 Tax=Hyposmocoma kahamanoa TaxID=1477025 RepID=UPI000E6D5BAE|nr:uncharacterized protein LOC113236111 [Hyposmocoma kahamanoa]
MFKIFAELQETIKVPDRERFKTVKCYPSGPEAIMLDNLAKKGFTTPYRMDGISLQFAELAIKELAKFHGLSFVLQELKPDYYKQKLMVLDQPFKFCEDWKTFYTNMLNQMSSNLGDARKKKLELLFPDFIKKLPKYLTDKEPVGSVVCHGDYRPNNMLMKESNGVVTEIIPVDYQTIYYGCPINDFIYFIITGTDKKLRKDHLNDLKNLYYHCLEQFVSYFDLDIEALYPRKEFERQYLERLDYGLMNGVVTEVIPVDYQTIYYGCPINDFIFFIITGTDKKLRKDHLNDLKNLYYHCLDKFVSYFDLDIKALYPREEFERQYLERLDYGLMVSIYLLPFIFASEDTVPDMGKENITNLEIKLDKRSKERIEGILDDYEEWGIILSALNGKCWRYDILDSLDINDVFHKIPSYLKANDTQAAIHRKNFVDMSKVSDAHFNKTLQQLQTLYENATGYNASIIENVDDEVIHEIRTELFNKSRRNETRRHMLPYHGYYDPFWNRASDYIARQKVLDCMLTLIYMARHHMKMMHLQHIRSIWQENPTAWLNWIDQVKRVITGPLP